MYMGALGQVRWRPTSSKYRNLPVAGERVGTSCPSGQVVIATGKNYSTGRDMVRCGVPPASAPVAPPAPQSQPVNVTTTVSPTFQQSFVPQVSPVMTVQTGSGSVDAGTGQQVEPRQSAGGGIEADLFFETMRQQIAAQDRAAQEAAAARAHEFEILQLQQEAREMARLEQIEAQKIAQAQAEADAETGATGATGSNGSTTTTPAPASTGGGGGGGVFMPVGVTDGPTSPDVTTPPSDKITPANWLWLIPIVGVGIFMMTKKGTKS